MRGWVARLGRFGDTIRLGRNGAAAQMGRSGDTMVCELARVLHMDAGRAARDALRYHVAGVQAARGHSSWAADCRDGSVIP